MAISWGLPKNDVEEGALKQIDEICKLKCLEDLTILPDVHKGYDAPIGSVVSLRGYVSPGMVGYDIGCGVSTLITPYRLEDFKIVDSSAKERLFMKLIMNIPIIHHEKKGNSTFDRDCIKEFKSVSAALQSRVSDVMKMQYGSLGSGNHFLEIGVNYEGYVCITVHSGSRRAGWEIGDYWMKRAQIEGTTFGKLSMFEQHSNLAVAYMNDYAWAVSYARNNRKAIIERTALIMGMHLDEIKKCEYINTVHNMVVQGNTVVTHRKGACPAFLHQKCLIPGNMRDGVFIANGTGNLDYQSSCSHGAGRLMSRGKALSSLTINNAFVGMEDIHHCKTTSTIDESPLAYKDIDYVLSLQDGVNINVIDHIKPIVGLKG